MKINLHFYNKQNESPPFKRSFSHAINKAAQRPELKFSGYRQKWGHLRHNLYMSPRGNHLHPIEISYTIYYENKPF